MLLPSSNINSLVYTLGETAEEDQRDQLQSMVDAESVQSYLSPSLGQHCIVRLSPFDRLNTRCHKSDWIDGWLDRQFESLTVLHDRSNVGFREFERPTINGVTREYGHITFLGGSEIIAISRHPTDDEQRLVDAFDGQVCVLRDTKNEKTQASMIAISRATPSAPRADLSQAVWHPIASVRISRLGDRTIQSFKSAS